MEKEGCVCVYVILIHSRDEATTRIQCLWTIQESNVLDVGCQWIDASCNAENDAEPW